MKVHFYYPTFNAVTAYCNAIGILSAVLKNNGHKVSAKILNDLNTLEKIVDEDINQINPDVIGISVVTLQSKYIDKIVKHIKNKSNALVIAGGIHATIAPEDLKQRGVDYVFQGEAENSLIEFIDKLEKREDVNEIRGVYPNHLAPLTDLTKIPQEDKEIMPFRDIIKSHNMWAGDIITTRGCPYDCTYCHNSTVNNLYRNELKIKTKDVLRQRPVEHIIQEFENLERKYKEIKMFVISDDTFTLNKSHCITVLKEYKNRIVTPFVCNINLLSFDRDIAKALKEAGCFEARFGLESGSERIRKTILNRHISNEEILKKTKIAEDYRLNLDTFNMVGLPTETIEDLEETLILNSKIKPRRIKFNIFYPFPLSPIKKICEDLGVIDYEKLGKLDNIQQELSLKFDEEYLQFFNNFWADMVGTINKYCGEERYKTMKPIDVGMLIKAEENIDIGIQKKKIK